MLRSAGKKSNLVLETWQLQHYHTSAVSNKHCGNKGTEYFSHNMHDNLLCLVGVLLIKLSLKSFSSHWSVQQKLISLIGLTEGRFVFQEEKKM